MTTFPSSLGVIRTVFFFPPPCLYFLLGYQSEKGNGEVREKSFLNSYLMKMET